MNDFDLFDKISNEASNSPKVIQKDCLHSIIVSDKNGDICSDCGEILESVNPQLALKPVSDCNRLQSRKTSEKNIFSDIENMGFDEKITNLANKIYLDVVSSNIKRNSSRKAIIFAAVFYSCNVFSPQNFEKLIQQFRINKKIALGGIIDVNLNISKDIKIKKNYITPTNFIENIMKGLCATEKQVSEAVEIYNKVKNKSSRINRSKPQSTSAGIVYYWITKNNIGITMTDFTKRVGVSAATIIKLLREIEKILDT